MPEMKDGCVKPVKGPLLPPSELTKGAQTASVKEVNKVQAHVGGEAIDFEANAFIAGKGFKPIKLSDNKGKWIILCFYPGDFTFV
jgi:peroxiredoxin (alkyl hydroperoxide reductase subunit C)